MDNNKLEKTLHTKRIIRNIGIAIAIAVAMILLVGILVSFARSYFDTESKTTKIGFEDIGELDTQVAYCTVVDVIEDPRKIFGMEVPFTKSKYIYSYDVVVKAGLNFDEIEYDITKNKIKIKMPEVYITDSYIDEASGKVYHEKESIFSPITLEEEMTARQDLVKVGVDDAIANGLYDAAKENAENLLTSFFKQHDEYKNLEMVFEWR